MPSIDRVLAVAPNGTMNSAALTVDIGQIVAINAITILDAGAEILATTNLCIKIPDTVNAVWDVADVTTAAYGGTANAKAEVAVTFPTVKVLRIDINADFTAGQTLVITGLSIIGQTGISGATVMQFAVDNAACTAGTYKDAATGAITVANGAEDLLGAVAITPSSTVSGASSNYTVDFTIPATGVLPRNGKVKITFPTNNDLTAAAAGVATLGGGSTVALTVASQVVTFTLQNDGTNSTAGAQQVIINGVKNSVGGGSQTLLVSTTTAADAALASGTSAAFTTAAATSTSRAKVSSSTTSTTDSTVAAATQNTVTGTATSDTATSNTAGTVTFSKPIAQMTTVELNAAVVEVQQAIVTLLQQLITALTEELKAMSH